MKSEKKINLNNYLELKSYKNRNFRVELGAVVFSHPSTMNQSIPQNHIFPFLHNEPKHSRKSPIKWMQDNNVEDFPWPQPQHLIFLSPDLNTQHKTSGTNWRLVLSVDGRSPRQSWKQFAIKRKGSNKNKKDFF